MARSRYDLAQDSTTLSEDTGTYYKDIFTIPIQKFRYEEPTIKRYLDEMNIRRPDIFIAKVYRFSELDDIVWWLNNIGLIYDVEIGTEIELPVLTDMENFYYTYRL